MNNLDINFYLLFLLYQIMKLILPDILKKINTKIYNRF